MDQGNTVKIRDLDLLAVHLAELKAAGKKVVLAHGVFDLLHMGHIRHLEQARKMGDVLVVSLTQDCDVNKGPGRPAFPQHLRAEAVAALAVVDYVAVNRWPSAVETIRWLRPDIFVKGQDYATAEDDVTGGITLEADAVRDVGGEIRFTSDITFSSSHLLNEYFSSFPADTERYLHDFRRAYSIDEVLSWLERITALRPVVVGDAILDEYLFCDGIGKSSKDVVLAVLQRSLEVYAGGSLMVANHLAGLCHDVRLVTQLGDSGRREEWIRGHLRSNIEPVLLTKTASPTVVKRRIVDEYSGAKLLEVYTMDDKLTSGEDETALLAALSGPPEDGDLTVVTDYGHGMLSPRAIEALCTPSRHLAVNAQSNAGNRGFNPIAKYRRADYVCMNSHELEVETRVRNNNDPSIVEKQVRQLSTRILCPRFTVTMGKSGSLHLDFATACSVAPALAARVMDRVGSGDAVMAVTAPLARVGAPGPVVAFIGNVAGAESVAQVGRRWALDRVALSKHIVALLK